MSRNVTSCWALGLVVLSTSACAIDTRDIMNDGPDPNAAAGGTTMGSGGSNSNTGGSGTGASDGNGGLNASGGNGNVDWPCRGYTTYADPEDPDSWLLDDLEHPNSFEFVALDGRFSSWTAEDDGSPGTNNGVNGGVYPILLPNESPSDHVLYFAASGYEGWGAVANLVLNQPASEPFYECAHDISGWTGVSFDLYGMGTSVNQGIFFGIAIDDVLPVELGGRCVNDCLATHQVEVFLPAEWTTIQVPFAELEQFYLAFADRIPFDPSRAVRLEFQVPRESDVEFYVDNVALY